MTRSILLLAGVLAGLIPAGAQQSLAPLDEAAFRKLVASTKGRVLLVNFWATWCEPCRAEMPALAKMHGALAGKGFRLVTVSADEPGDEAAARLFLAQAGINGPAYIKRAANDEKFIDSIDPKWSGALPFSVLFDRAGSTVRTFTGEVDLKALETAVRRLL